MAPCRRGANLTFPLNNGSGGANRKFTLTTGTNSVVDTTTNGYNVEFDQNITGSGNLSVTGTGNVTLGGIPSTTVIGNVAVAAGATLTLSPIGNTPSFGISASTSPGTVGGSIVIAEPIQVRLYGGDFNGGGNFTVEPSGQLLISEALTTIDNNIVLNPGNIPSFETQIGADHAGADLTINGVISGASDIDFTGGSGNITLGGNSMYTGTTKIDNAKSGGSVVLAVNNALPTGTDVTLTSTGNFDLAGFNQTIDSINEGSSTTGVIQNSNSTTNSVLTISSTTAAGSTTYPGLIEDTTFGATLGLTLQGSADLTLPTPELYSGPISILGGRIQLTGISTTDNTTGLGAASSISIGGGSNPDEAQLRFNGVTGTISYATLNHPSATPPVITLNSMGGYTSVGGTVDNGAIRVDNGATISLPDNIVFAATSSIDVTTSSVATFTGVLSGPGTLISLGDGVITLTGNNANISGSYTGGTDIEAGTINVQPGSAIGAGPLTVNNVLNVGVGTIGINSVLNLNNGAQSVGSLSGSIAAPATGVNTATIQLASGTVLTVNQTVNGTFAGAIAGAGALIETGTGTLTLSGINGYTGNTNVNGGILVIDYPGSLSDANVTVAAGAQLNANGTLAANTDLTVSGKAVFGPNANSGILGRSLAALNIGTGGSVTVAPAALTGGPQVNPNRTVLVTGTLSFADSTGTLDLGNNDLIVHSGSGGELTFGPVSTAGTIENEVATGRGSNGAWTGNGIRSSAAAASPSNMALAAVINDTHQSGSLSGATLWSTFDGVPVADGDILVKYTYYGDATLTGSVTAADYFQIDNGFNAGGTLKGWYNGDFNYDGVINGDDYSLIDNAFNSQGSTSFAGVSAGPAEMIASDSDQIAPAAIASPAVPEPGTLSLIGLGALGLLARRRRRIS